MGANISKTRRFCAGLCGLVLCLALMPAQVLAETAQEKVDRLQKELDSIGESISSLKGQRADAEAVRGEYQRQQAVILDLMDATRESIGETEGHLATTRESVAEKMQQVDESQALLEQRMVASYKMNNATMLSTLLNVNSLSELLTVSRSLQQIVRHDTELIETLGEQKQELDGELVVLDGQLVELQEKYAGMQELVDLYAGNIKAQDDTISDLAAQQAAEQEAYNVTLAEKQRAEAEMQAIADAAANNGSKPDDGSAPSVDEEGFFVWPVPGFFGTTTEFGQPDPWGIGHKGLDIAGGGIAGATVVAGGSGTVQVAGWNDSYGNYIIIDHGGGLRTLYAHLASISVSAGASVSRGGAIGTVGNTGDVFGPTGYHLHFEVQVNGTRVNPRGYLA